MTTIPVEEFEDDTFGNPLTRRSTWMDRLEAWGFGQTTEAGLREHFGKFGELQDVALMRNKHTGQPRGFGFVKFKDNSGACVVLSLFLRFVRWRPWTPFQI